MDSLRGPDQEAMLFLCCSTDHCENFTRKLREEMHLNPVHHVADARHIVEEIDRVAPQVRRAIVVLDGEGEMAWAGYEALRASHLRRVPVLAICDRADQDAAYARGVNAVIARESWQHNMGRLASHITQFWLRLVRLPAISQRSLVSRSAALEASRGIG